MDNIWGKRHREKVYTEPCSDANAISYKTFCQLGALLNPRLRRRQGKHACTYHQLNF